MNYRTAVKGDGSPSQRRIDGIYGTTLAADIAQTALLKKRGQKYRSESAYLPGAEVTLLISSLNTTGKLYSKLRRTGLARISAARGPKSRVLFIGSLPCGCLPSC